jgi:hypothetical protein
LTKIKSEVGGRCNQLAIVGLIVLLGVVYLSTLLPGVGSGDSAELQYCSALLGICHPPGYQIEVTFGKVFSMLPIGPGEAWRVNFMMAVFGTIGCLAVYGAVRRVCGFIIPALAAATTLGFSSIYWTHSLHAEAYVFYSAFLLLGIYATVRFVESNKARWLYLTALFLGICVADRSSELFVLPAFFVLWLFVRKKVSLNLTQVVVSLVVFILPFIYTTSFYIVRKGPEHLARRDNALRNRIISGKFEPRKRTVYEQIWGAVHRCLGLTYIKKAGFSKDRMLHDVDKYAWLLSGLGASGDKFATTDDDRQNNEQGRGTSVGILGLLLAAAAFVFWRRQYGWILFGLALFLGNLVFILWHSRWDNLTFTIPGLAGLCFLAGLGAVGPAGWQGKRRRIVFQSACFLVPLFLLVTNYRLMDMSTKEQVEQLKYHHQLAEMPLPEKSVIINTYWPAMVCRYLYYVEAGRPDIHVVYFSKKNNVRKLYNYFNSHGQPVFVESEDIDEESSKSLLKRTPKEITELGFVLLNPKVLGR